MNCIYKNTPLFLLAASLMVGTAAAAEKTADDLWSLRSVTILSFGEEDVEVEAAEDKSGVRLVFSAWSETQEAVIERSLHKTGIEYSVFPSRQGTAMVELHSTTGALKFNTRENKGNIRIALGNERPELYPIKKLLDDKSTSPLPGVVASHLHNSKLNKARTELLRTNPEEQWEKDLLRSRIILIDAAMYGGVPEDCMSGPGSYEYPEQKETALLSAVCYFLTNNLDKAYREIEKIEERTEDEPLKKRADLLKQEFLVSRLLQSSRIDDKEELAGTFSRFADSVCTSSYSIQILEHVASVLQHLGLGKLLADKTDMIIARLSPGELKDASPALVETYFSAGQYIKALDAASYFLDRRLEDWAEGRLLRVRGHVHLQLGNWSSAKSDLEAAAMLINVSDRDRLALYEVYVRMGLTPQFSPELQSIPASLNKLLSAWLQRLNIENELYHKDAIESGRLTALPGHVLYKALLHNNRIGEVARSRLLRDELLKRKGVFSRLATIEQDIQLIEDSISKMKSGETK